MQTNKYPWLSALPPCDVQPVSSIGLAQEEGRAREPLSDAIPCRTAFWDREQGGTSGLAEGGKGQQPARQVEEWPGNS